jgi:hypothetical protein
MTRFLRQYWPLLAIVPVAIALDVTLAAIGEAWSASEWASNIIFAYAATLATVVLARRQENLQESSAATELWKTIASISGTRDDMTSSAGASAVRRILIDARAGVHLLSFADQASRSEYLSTVRRAVDDVLHLITGSVRPYTLWSEPDWSTIAADTGNLRRELTSLKGIRGPEAINLSELITALDAITEETRAHDLVPYQNFERSYRRGDVSNRIRVLLNWDLLHDYVDRRQATIRIHRAWAADWLQDNTVYSVWYARADQSEATFASAEWRDADVQPITVNDLNTYFDAMPESRKADITSLVAYLSVRQAGVLPTIEVVTLEISKDTLIILDGNHRLGAVVRGRGNRRLPLLVNIVEYRVSVPYDPELLPDLRFHRQD